MSRNIKYFFIKLLADLFRGLGSVYSHVAGFFRIIFFPFIALGTVLFRWMIIPLFRLWLVVGRMIAKALIPAKNSLLSLSAHRYVVHALVIIIVMTVSVFNVRSYTAHSESFGDASVFSKLMNGDVSVNSDTVEEVVDLHSENAARVVSSRDGALSVATSLPIGSTTDSENSESIFSTPDASTPVPAVISAPLIASRSNIQTYTVEDGDTLWDISKKFGIDVPTLLATNDLGPRGIIRPKDVIKILPVSGVLHIVKKGENVGAIAKKYAVEISDILKANQLTESSTLSLGDELIVPGGSADANAPPKPKVVAVVKPKVIVRAETAAPVATLFKETPKPVDAAATGEWVWPSQGHLITQPFKGKAHTGVDIDGAIGTPNYAAHEGVVEFAGWSVGYGLSIVVNHGNGLWTRYGHNSQIFVKIGDTVKAGQNISLMGTTGKSTGSHLHFEVLTGPGKFVNPLKYIRK